MDGFLYIVIGLAVLAILLFAMLPDIYNHYERKRDKRLNRRPKRRIKL